MTKSPNPLGVELKGNHVLVDSKLKVSFRRTIRVPDNQQISDLPPSLGAFPLKRVSEYFAKLPNSMAAKGGLFFPMYRKYRAIVCIHVQC
jgi:hypothetical protein